MGMDSPPALWPVATYKPRKISLLHNFIVISWIGHTPETESFKTVEVGLVIADRAKHFRQNDSTKGNYIKRKSSFHMTLLSQISYISFISEIFWYSIITRNFGIQIPKMVHLFYRQSHPYVILIPFLIVFQYKQHLVFSSVITSCTCC